MRLNFEYCNMIIVCTDIVLIITTYSPLSLDFPLVFQFSFLIQQFYFHTASFHLIMREKYNIIIVNHSIIKFCVCMNNSYNGTASYFSLCQYY